MDSTVITTIPAAIPPVNNSPQIPPYGLRTERITNSSFTAPGDKNIQTWLYRVTSMLNISEFIPYESELPNPGTPSHFRPMPIYGPHSPGPRAKTGDRNAFLVATEALPRSGALDIQTELRKLLVRQKEIAVVPRGEMAKTAAAGLDWTIFSRFNGRLWTASQDHTPFDVFAWHGTCYPYKYDLGRFCVLGNVLFGEHDPCLYTALTAPSHHSGSGTAVVDFAIIPPRWQASEVSMWLPYFHQNVMQEFALAIVNN
ncbi:RmlC-like cupin domain-containing protein [Xylariaceae sp. FL0255]|nr:RmlC-like cupin domain-containing protein [Xylariaceae sp. FL0255]